MVILPHKLVSEQAEFHEYLARVRTEHKPKRNFIKLVDKIG